MPSRAVGGPTRAHRKGRSPESTRASDQVWHARSRCVSAFLACPYCTNQRTKGNTRQRRKCATLGLQGVCMFIQCEHVNLPRCRFGSIRLQRDPQGMSQVPDYVGNAGCSGRPGCRVCGAVPDRLHSNPSRHRTTRLPREEGGQCRRSPVGGGAFVDAALAGIK